MLETMVRGVRIRFSGAESLPLAVVQRSSPAYDSARNFFTVTMKNESSQTLHLPFDEISRNTVLVYRHPVTHEVSLDNRTPPPRKQGLVTELLPGALQSYQVVFEYPQQMAAIANGVAEVQFCVRWQSDWLRQNSYEPGSYNWNESFELCQQVKIML